MQPRQGMGCSSLIVSYPGMPFWFAKYMKTVEPAPQSVLCCLQAYHFDVTMHPMRRPRPGEDEAMASAPSLQDRPPPVEMTRFTLPLGCASGLSTRLCKLLRL